MQAALRRRAAHNGLELSCRASRIRFRTGRFSAAGPVSCSELFGGSGTPPPSEAYILQPAGFASSQAAPGFLHAFQEPRIVL